MTGVKIPRPPGASRRMLLAAHRRALADAKAGCMRLR